MTSTRMANVRMTAVLLCTLESFAAVPMASAGASGFAQMPARQTAAAQCDATADPAAVVVHGDARFTVLTPTLIRMEAAPFDDRCSFTVVSRRWTAAPPFSRTVHPNGTLVIETANLVLQYTPSPTASGSTAAAPVQCPSNATKQVDVDPVHGRRTSSQPSNVPDTVSCCARCVSDPDCVAFVFGEAFGPDPRPVNGSLPNCWLLASVGTTKRHVGRVLWRVRKTAPPSPPLPPSPPRPPESPVFPSTALSVMVKSLGTVWHPGASSSGNLGGTISSWNEVNPADVPEALGEGLVSRDGWAIVDDSRTPRFSASTDRATMFLGRVPWVDPDSLARRTASVAPAADWYFFGCGLEYARCLSDFGGLSGRPPIPPLAALGIWWSHYETYSATTIQTEVLAGFANFSLPLNVLQMDCGWHTANPTGDPKCNGYQGFDWNSSLFPNPRSYVATVRDGNWSSEVGPAPQQPLKLILNTHNFEGVDRCQSEYHAVAERAGWPTADGDPVPFNLTSLPTMTAVFQLLLSRNATGTATSGTRPDWWWTDGSLSKWSTAAGTGLGSNADNLFTSTYLHSAAIEYGNDTAANRSLVMPRYAGLGQHRFCCGFSGDADSTWTTLRAEVIMTATAANVAFGFWSHDIGGFRGDPGPELYARWTQFGALSPLWRSHGANKGSPRRYWLFSSFQQIREAMALRVRLAPLLYTLAAESTRTGLAMVRPLYYVGDPADSMTYADKYTYCVGDTVLVRPVVDPLQPNTSTVPTSVWLPALEGGKKWVDWNSSTVLSGGRNVTVEAGLADLPLFVRAGTVLPLLPSDTTDVTVENVTVWTVFPGEDTGHGLRYWDDTKTTAYRDRGASAIQNFSYTWDARHTSLTCIVSPALPVGGFSVPTVPHRHIVELRGGPFSSMTRGTFNNMSGVTTVATRHSLAIPIGTVQIVAPVLVSLTQSVTIVIIP